jgi:hypothetical protein
MKTTVKIEKEVEIKTLEVAANVRYWEDAKINGVEDENGDLTPCRKGDLWCPVIDVDTGIIKDWPNGIRAKIHFKVCDDGSYYLKDGKGNTILSIEENYVPSILCPKEIGFGDYIIMDILENGQIEGWDADISDFVEQD